MLTPIAESSFNDLKTFFERDACQRATKPLRDGIEIAIYVDGGGPLTLTKVNGRANVISGSPAKPDMSFWTTTKGVKQLAGHVTDDIGEIGVAILQLMAAADPELHMKAKVHIGLFDLLRNGYLGVIPLGGPSVMKYLGSKGFGSIGKIKDAISRMRS